MCSVLEWGFQLQDGCCSSSQERRSLLDIGESRLSNNHTPVVCLCFDTLVFILHLRGEAVCRGGADASRLSVGIPTAATVTGWQLLFWVKAVLPGVIVDVLGLAVFFGDSYIYFDFDFFFFF